MDRGTDQSINVSAEIPEPFHNVGGADLHRSAPGREFFGSRVTLSSVSRDLQRHRTEGAKHEQCAMSKVDDSKSAEYECQAERDQRICAALVQAV